MAKTTRIKKNLAPPDGYDKIKPTIDKLVARLKSAQAESNKTVSRNQSLWPIYKLNHQISRYIYDMYYTRKLISKQLYDWLLLQSYANKDLIAKWKKQGYETLCCVNCIMVQDKNHNQACICRVPKSTLIKNNDEKPVECITCGCRGCASSD
jgi:bud site selection protein 31